VFLYYRPGQSSGSSLLSFPWKLIWNTREEVDDCLHSRTALFQGGFKSVQKLGQ
jgi:hypothetical protein